MLFSHSLTHTHTHTRTHACTVFAKTSVPDFWQSEIKFCYKPNCTFSEICLQQQRTRLLPLTIAREVIRPRRTPSREGTPTRQGKLTWTLEMEAAFLDYVKKYGRKWAKVEEAIYRTGHPLLMGLDKVKLNDKFKALKKSGRINVEDYPVEGEPEDFY
uniref:Myb-like domain-containing protein n=1 Tax=Dunaliella tertiolecta TaxID=3047 RepID=A0A7S3QT45_DUNTE